MENNQKNSLYKRQDKSTDLFLYQERLPMLPFVSETGTLNIAKERHVSPVVLKSLIENFFTDGSN